MCYLPFYQVAHMTIDFKLCFFLISLICHNTLVSPIQINCAILPLLLFLLLLITAMNPPKLWCSDQGKSQAFCFGHVIPVLHPTSRNIYCFCEIPQSPPNSHQQRLCFLGAHCCTMSVYPAPPCSHTMANLGLG